MSIVIMCERCGAEYDAPAHRWRCPICGWKSHCCEGEPQPEEPQPEAKETLEEFVGEDTWVVERPQE